MKNKFAPGNVQASTMIIWLFLFSFVPLCLMIIVSLLSTPSSTNSSHLVTLPWTITHYTTLLSPIYVKILIRSCNIALITCFFCLILAYPFSYLIVKSKYKSVLLLGVMIPFWTSSLVRTYALLCLLKNNGLLNTILIKLHILHEPMIWLYTPFAVISGLVYTLFPFMVLPLITNMERFDQRLIEAAKDLGARPLRIFFHVYLPYTKTGITNGCLLVFLPAMTLFYIPNILGGARSLLIGNVIQHQFLVLEDWPQGAATSLMLTILLVSLCLGKTRPQKSGAV